MKYNFIAIEGNIGAGKTTLATKIAEHFDAKLVLEQFEENPFLPNFYKDAEKYSFPLELSFLAGRYQQLKDRLPNQDLFKSFTISDYLFDKSLIFAKINLPPDEFRLFSKLFTIINSNLPKPDLLVYLFLDVRSTQANIKIRGREYEQKIHDAYLEKVQNGYMEYFKHLSNQRILIMDINGVDFVSDPSAYKGIIEALDKPYDQGITRLVFSEKRVHSGNQPTFIHYY